MTREQLLAEMAKATGDCNFDCSLCKSNAEAAVEVAEKYVQSRLEDANAIARQADEALRGALMFEMTGAADPFPELRWSAENAALQLLAARTEVVEVRETLNVALQECERVEAVCAHATEALRVLLANTDPFVARTLKPNPFATLNAIEASKAGAGWVSPEEVERLIAAERQKTVDMSAEYARNITENHVSREEHEREVERLNEGAYVRTLGEQAEKLIMERDALKTALERIVACEQDGNSGAEQDIARAALGVK